MSTLVLTIVRSPGHGVGETREAGGELTVGRGAQCGWVLADPQRSLSRVHCRLENIAGHWQLHDLSVNGTFINGSAEPLGRDRAHVLADGDRVMLGDYEIQVRLVAPRQPDPRSIFDPGAAASPFGSSPAGGGFGGARLPGLDDPLSVSPAFAPASPSPYGAMPDHSPAGSDAYAPPPVASPGPVAAPDDWFRSALLPRPGRDAPPAAAMDAQRFDEHLRSDDVTGPGAGRGTTAAAPDPLAPYAPAVPGVPATPSAGAFAPGGPAAAQPGHPAYPSHPAGMPAVAQPPRLPDTPLAAYPPESHPAAPAAAAAAPPFGAPVAAPHPAAPGAPGGASALAALAALLQAAGIPPETVLRANADPEPTLRQAGALLQAAVAGMRALLVARGLVKREFRIEQTMLRPKENNPLKFAASDEQALAALLDPRTNGLQAMQQAVGDLTQHEVAMLAATQAAARAMLDKLAPAGIEAEDAGGGLLPGALEKRLWTAYKRRHAKLLEQLEDDFESAFGTAFARAYEQASGSDDKR